MSDEKQFGVYELTPADITNIAAHGAKDKRITELEQQNARLTQIISEEPRTKTALPDEFQRLWQACLTLAEKAEFKACFRYLEKLEKQLAERDGLIREYMTESLPYSQRAIEIQQQLETEGGESEPIREGATSYGWSSGFVTDRDREGPPDPRVPYPKINTDIRVSVPCKHCGGENYFTLTNRGEE